MQVNSVSLNSTSSKPAFKSFQSDVETLAMLDDNTVRKIAYAKASHDVNDKKHKRITNALYYSIPLAAGLAAAVRTPKFSKYTRSLKLNNFVATTLNWAGTFAVIDLVFGAKRRLDRKNPTMNEFTKNHPVVSTLATIGASIGAIFALGKGASKLTSKFASKLTFKDLRSAVTFNNKLNNNKFLNKASEKLAKVPAGIKGFAKGVLDYAPMLLIFSSIAHSFGHERVKATEYQNNYRDIKTAQAMIREGLSNRQQVKEAADIDEV